MEKWETILIQLLGKVYNFLENQNVGWVIMGSTSTALHGINIIPKDIDILMEKSDDVYHFANLMHEFTVEKCEISDPHNSKWKSSKELPVFAEDPNPEEAVWHFGRWYINDFKVEVAHIEPPENYLKNKKPKSGIWEGGPEVWTYVNSIKLQEYNIPVIPLEIQLETNLKRNFNSRISKIIEYFKLNGYDKNLLEISLSEKNMKNFNKLISG